MSYSTTEFGNCFLPFCQRDFLPDLGLNCIIQYSHCALCDAAYHSGECKELRSLIDLILFKYRPHICLLDK